MQAEAAERGQTAARSEPLAHGRPGVGKTKGVLLKIKELFEDVCGFEQGIDYQFATLQAVTAKDFGGDTLHHALGIQVFRGARGRGGCRRDKQTQLSKALSRMRWLIVDEVSMADAPLNAAIDVQLRNLVQQHGTYKQDRYNMDRPFGGLNVLFCLRFLPTGPANQEHPCA